MLNLMMDEGPCCCHYYNLTTQLPGARESPVYVGGPPLPHNKFART